MKKLIARTGLAALSMLALGAGACREQQSFVVITVLSANDTPISGIATLVVTVVNGGSSKEMTYPIPPEQIPLTLTNIADARGVFGKTFSVSFTLGHSDLVKFYVAARDASGCTIGLGMADGTIQKGGVAAVRVELDHASGPCLGADGGADGAGVTFPGCDPTTLSCNSPTLTCAVNCAALQGQCVTAGATPPGGLCDQQGNADCTPGTQCFTYSAPACNVHVCLKFCRTDDDCGPASSGSLCQGKVPCSTDAGTLLTAYHTCTFGCDPRGTATTGCPTGLHCFVVENMDQVDCACTEETRTKAVGQACLRGVDCAPGSICDLSTGKCQTICKRSLNGADCAANQSCHALTGDQVYGDCIP